MWCDNNRWKGTVATLFDPVALSLSSPIKLNAVEAAKSNVQTCLQTITEHRQGKVINTLSRWTATPASFVNHASSRTSNYLWASPGISSNLESIRLWERARTCYLSSGTQYLARLPIRIRESYFWQLLFNPNNKHDCLKATKIRV